MLAVGPLIPIRDINPRVHVPYVNYLILAACIAVFLYQLALGSEVESLVATFGFTPADLSEALAEGSNPAEVGLRALTSMFLHAGWFHIIGNLLYLRVFGDNVEDRFGHVAFMLFYLFSGLAGATAQYAVDPESTVPMVGASGAIAGVLGAYIVMFPRARILTVFPVFILLTFIEVPAVLFLGVWGLQQLLNGYLTITLNAQGGEGGVAWFAHLGGFSLGLIAGLLGRLKDRRKRSRR